MSIDKLILDKIYRKKLDAVGKILVDNIKQGFDNSVGGSHKIVDTIHYEIKDNEVHIKGSPVVKFIDEGTKPHIIRAKTSKGLMFRSFGTVRGKSGHVFKDGDWIRKQEVKHPGIDARAFMNVVLFLSKKQIIEEFKKDGSTPTLTFVIDGNKLYSYQ